MVFSDWCLVVALAETSVSRRDGDGMLLVRAEWEGDLQEFDGIPIMSPQDMGSLSMVIHVVLGGLRKIDCGAT